MLLVHIRSGLEECYNIQKTNGVNADYAATIKRIKEDIDELEEYDQSLLSVSTDDETESTLLTMAARYNCFGIARYLLDKFEIAKLDHPNKYNLTAYDYVRTADMPVYDATCEMFFKTHNGVVVSIKGKPLIHQNREFAQYLQAKIEEQRKAKFMHGLQAQNKQDLAAKKDHKEDEQAQFAAIVEAPSAQQPQVLSEKECDELTRRFNSYAKQVVEKSIASSKDGESRRDIYEFLDTYFATYINREVENLVGKTNSSILRKRLEDAYSSAKYEIDTQKQSKKKKERRRERALAGHSDAMKYAVQAMTMWDVHQDPYWGARYRGDANALAARNSDGGLASYNDNEYVKWWKDHQTKNKDCVACKNHALAMKNRKSKQQRRNSF